MVGYQIRFLFAIVSVDLTARSGIGSEITEIQTPPPDRPGGLSTGRPRLRAGRPADAQRFRCGAKGPKVPVTFAGSLRRVRGRKSWRAAHSGRVSQRCSGEFQLGPVRIGPALQPRAFEPDGWDRAPLRAESESCADGEFR